MRRMTRLLLAALPVCLPLHAALAAADVKLLEEARSAAGAMPPRLLVVLKEEIDKGGPEAAIDACRVKAPQMANEASERSGWSIRRVSLKNRNPKAVPDAWERAALEDFDRRAAAGENPAALERAEVVADGSARVYRYIKALPTQPLCVACHGKDADIPPAVKARLADHYPEDKGTGYSPGQIRGAITVRRPL